jgi:exopolysaccharide production protein ExoQ
MGERLMNSIAFHLAQEQAAPKSGALPVAAIAGFFFIFRATLTFLFFQANPVAGTALTVIAGLALVYGALLFTAGAAHGRRRLARNATLLWIAALLAISLLSLTWGQAQSVVAAAAYWAALAADVTVVLLVLRVEAAAEVAESLMAGAVCGGVMLSFIAWCSPVTEDLRLGNDEFLHPNTLGLEIGLCVFMAQFLSRRGKMWNWIAAGLALTLLRALSKTAIVAFFVAEAWYLLQSRQWTRAARVRIAAAALLVVACSWRLLSTYFDLYVNSSGRQFETLTGRTLLWTIVLSMGLERPWFGHGFYSFKSLVPSLGVFVPVHAHNELLHQFFELGVVGVVTVIGIYATFLYRARQSSSGELRTLAIALWIFTVVRGLADAVPAELCFPLWLMVALTVRLEPVQRKASLR